MSNELQTQIDALQAKCTQLENERRAWKLRCEGVRAVLETFLEESILNKILGRASNSEEANAGDVSIKQTADAYRKLADRIELLEHDAWTGAATLVRTFIKESRLVTPDHASVFVREWRDQFKKLWPDEPL